ncbi:prenyltransferase/squalene oxidase repeat-containing protein [Streptomyces sp. NPDC051018]|uniref:prenyltransferase/squalene oxidase repeat-containing protein n=1 Tax=Streptomyces sp. NPDC051018 TaxID=3365639 RepID=UPI003793F899
MGTGLHADRYRSRGRRLLSLGTAALLTLGAAVSLLTAPATATAAPVEECTPQKGAVVAVDFSKFGGKVERGCDTTPTTGFELLHEAGFTTTGTQSHGDAFICRIGHGSTGTQYPTPAQEDCVQTPQASAYWSYWIASPGQKSWTYSPLGAMSRTPRAGDVDAWVFGATDIGGTTGKPSFSPDDVRAGGDPGPGGPGDPGGPGVPPGSVDVPAAVRWLGQQLKDGERVVDPETGAPRHTETAEAVLALAAADRGSPAAKKAAAYLATPAQTEAYAYPDGKDQPPSATAAARLALVALAAGENPRAFGGRDLLGDLLKYVCPAPVAGAEPVPGCLTEGDFRTTFQAEGQALAVVALLNGKATPPPASVARLTGLQCEDGGFTGILIRAGEWCDSEPGTTGLILLALHRAGGHDAVVAKGREYLTKTQLTDGGWPASAYSTAGSAPSTGWAVQALRVLGDRTRAAAGTSWLSRQQLPGGAFSFEDGLTEPKLYATVPATIAGAGTDLLALTTEPPEEPKPPVTPPGKSPDLRKATAYLTHTSRLLQGRYYENARGSGFADYGLTIDGAFALAATGHDNNALRTVVDFLDGGGKDGTGRTLHDWTKLGTKYAGGGSIAKAALLAEAVGRDPRDFGGKNLLAALASGVCSAKSPAPDRSCAAKGAYTNATSVFSQSLGVIAQLRANDTTAAAEPIAYLKSLQEPSGAWPSLIGEASEPEVDSTAMAAMALDLLPDAGSQAAVDRALTWLAGRQLADGGFPGASGNSVNSAALAIQALSLDAADHRAKIGKARAFLASQQNADGGFNVAKGGQRGSDVRASTQAAGGSTGISFGTLSRSLNGTTPRPPGAGDPGGNPTPPRIVTPGEDGGGPLPQGEAGGSGGGPLASTGVPGQLLAAVAAALTAAGCAVTLLVRRRRTRTAAGEPS